MTKKFLNKKKQIRKKRFYNILNLFNCFFKPKYAHKLIETHKRRELEKLLHDERTYRKEREQEAGEFEDKEVFITGEYRKQIEEREKFRKELELSDKMDGNKQLILNYY